MEASGVSGTKRKRDEGEADTSKGKLYCRICEVWCNSEEMMEKHVKGRKHRAKQITEDDIRGEPGRREQARKRGLWCGTCDVVCNSETTMQRHLNGRKHKAGEAKKRRREERAAAGRINCLQEEAGALEDEEKEEEEENKDEDEKMDGLWCEICKVNCNSKLMMEAHFEGKKHRAKAAKPGYDGPAAGQLLARNNGNLLLLLHGLDEVKKEKNRELWCFLCGFKCDGQPAMAKHLNGPDHKAKSSLRWGKHETSILPTKQE